MKFDNIVCWITEDVRRLAAFYEKVLQIRIDANDLHVEIPLDGARIILYAKSAAERDMGFDFSVFGGTGMVKISFSVEDVDAEYERLKELGVQVMTPPTTYPWGARSMHFRDVDGNIVCFVCRNPKN